MIHRARRVRPALAAVALAASSLGVLALPAEPADALSTCRTAVGGKTFNYICEYGTTPITYQGRRHVFLIGADDSAVWHIWETCRACGTYSNWTSLGGVARSRAHVMIADAYGDSLKLTVRGTYNGCWNRFYNSSSAPGRWTPWYDQPDYPEHSCNI